MGLSHRSSLIKMLKILLLAILCVFVVSLPSPRRTPSQTGAHTRKSVSYRERIKNFTCDDGSSPDCFCHGNPASLDEPCDKPGVLSYHQGIYCNCTDGTDMGRGLKTTPTTQVVKRF